MKKELGFVYSNKQSSQIRLVRWEYEPKKEIEFLAKFLVDYLKGNEKEPYEVVIQPRIDSDRPSLAVLRKGHGVVLVNVVEWNPDDYADYDKDMWTHKETGKQILSPFKKVQVYKNNCFDYHIPGLKEAALEDEKRNAVIAMWVYFHNASARCVEKIKACQKKWLGKSEYNAIFTREQLIPQKLNELAYKAYLSRKSRYFTEEMYNSFKKKMYPFKIVTNSEPKEAFTKKQQDIINSDKSPLCVQGAAGSGKTTALVRRIKRFQKKDPRTDILVLTFNITLRWYIENRLREIGVDLNRVEVSHYHEFIRAYRLNNDLRPVTSDSPIDISREEITENAQRYKYIFVDEIQDFKKDWITSIENVLADDGMISYFGDKEQTIYNFAEKINPKLTIKGVKRLSKSFRLSSRIVDLANDFLAQLLEKRDVMIESRQINLYGKISYCNISKADSRDIKRIYEDFFGESLNENETCFLATKIDSLRQLDKYFRVDLGKKTVTMFEKQEEYDRIMAEKNAKIEQLEQQYGSSDTLDKQKKEIEEHAKQSIDYIRRSKKFNFNAEESGIKMSTIHSFKGWEAKKCVLIIENREIEEENSSSRATDEVIQTEKEIPLDALLYVGITRCKEDLLIINIGDCKCDTFFRSVGYCEQIV